MKISELVRQIKDAAQAYYEGEPVMSDQEFDRLVELLVSKKPDHKLLQTPGWGYVPENHLQKFKHHFHVGSLGKIKQADYEKDKRLPFNDFVLSMKLDGGSAVAYYKEGKLVSVLSRGDGHVGLDITANLTHSGTVPQTVSDHTILAVRGEVVLTQEGFDQVGGSNPRNVAVGLSQSKNGDPEELKHLRFIACGVPWRSKRNSGYRHAEDLFDLEDQGFDVVPHLSINEEEFSQVVKKGVRYGTLKKLFVYGKPDDYPIDGLVLTKGNYFITSLDGIVQYQSIAFKFHDAVKKTTVKDIEWNTSRTGRIVPVALIEPVRLDGAVVRRVTMNNLSFLTENRIGEGAVVEISRSNMVIPMLVRVLEPSGAKYPASCPSCSQKTGISGRDLVCENESCPAKNSGALSVFWNMVKPDRVGPALLRRLEAERRLVTVADVKHWAQTFSREDYEEYGMATREMLAKMAGMILSFRSSIAHVLRMASLPQVGKNTAFAFQFAMTPSEFTRHLGSSKKLPEHWKELATTAPAYRAISDNREKLLELCKLFPMEEDKAVPVKVRICLTGALSKPRHKLMEDWSKKGVAEAPVKSCDLLIADKPSNSSKYKTAIERGVPIMTEAEFVTQYL